MNIRILVLKVLHNTVMTIVSLFFIFIYSSNIYLSVFLKDGSYKLHGNRLMKYNKESKLYGNIDSLNEQKLFVLQSFNEKNTLDEIALEFSARFKLDKNVAYQQVKTFFIDFAKIMVCHPKNAHL